KEIQDMLKESPVPGAKEWAIHDYDGFCGVPISETEDVETVAELGAMIHKHGEAFALYADHVGAARATEERFLDAYCGEWESELAYAKDCLQDTCERNTFDYLTPYIDFDAFARDLFQCDYYSLVGESGRLYVFCD
ncbi:MAG: antirestriction protein ArdA, partial [Alphaproteobacteria bacterium]